MRGLRTGVFGLSSWVRPFPERGVWKAVGWGGIIYSKNQIDIENWENMSRSILMEQSVKPT